ncbi:RES family NAD+ phosphorylase, partial [Streptomyces wadayamensis]
MTGLFPMTSLELHPVRHVIPAGTELWRVHNVRYAPHLFNPKLADPFEFKDGSRFDGTRLDPYHCLYLGDTPTTALAESVLRSRPFELPAGRRRIPYVTVVGRCLSVLRTRCDLVLVSLIEAKDLAAVCQESTLLEDERNYVSARRWASEIRAQAPDV